MEHETAGIGSASVVVLDYGLVLSAIDLRVLTDRVENPLYQRENAYEGGVGVMEDNRTGGTRVEVTDSLFSGVNRWVEGEQNLCVVTIRWRLIERSWPRASEAVIAVWEIWRRCRRLADSPYNVRSGCSWLCPALLFSCLYSCLSLLYLFVTA